jgi:hypothetical protein
MAAFARTLRDQKQEHKMPKQIRVTMIAFVAVFAFSSVAWAQGGRRQRGNQQNGQAAPQGEAIPSIPFPEGWKACPRCQNNTDRARDNQQYKTEGHPSNAHDLTGKWGWDGVATAFRDAKGAPPFTPEGKKRFDATIGEKAPDGTPLRSKDTSGRGGGSKINCDPYGWPRLYTYHYGYEFVTLPDRVLQFFELNHTWRTIWTDGRKLPENPPEPRWMGWNVGHWEGDTFVIESTGYDERPWLSAANPDGGWIHSDELKVVERWRRTKFGTLESEITVTDPKIYTQPWTVKGVEYLVPGAELGEQFCVPSDYNQFNDQVFSRAAGTDK